MAAGSIVILFVFRFASIPRSVAAGDALSQGDFSSVQSEGWGSYVAAIGIASGTVTEIGTTTAALGNFSMAYLGWECEMRIENYAVPYWCEHYIPLTVATTTMVGTGTMAYVFQNPHQIITGDAQIYYVEYYPGDPDYMGFGTATNIVPGLSWSWTCGPYCRNGGILGGTSPYFVPYLQMGPQADPPSVTALVQSGRSGEPAQAGDAIDGSVVTLGAKIASAANDALVFEVEVRPMGTPFGKTATASSSVTEGGDATIDVELTDGDYHWAARAVDTVTAESSPWIEFSSRVGLRDFAIRRPKEPIVFVPGMLGTRLMRTADGREVWPDISTLLFSPDDRSLDDLMLAADGTQEPGRELAAASVLDRVSALGIEVPLYENLFQTLTADGYSVGATLFPVPYDWRLGTRTTADAVAKAVDEARAASSDGRISIVGYSLGGLAVKEYLSEQSDPSFVDKLILVGVPQLGAPEAFQALTYGDNLGFRIPVVNLDILNRGEVKRIAQNMPALYDLLPSRAYLADAGGYIEDFRNSGSSLLDYDETDRLMLADPADRRNGALLAAADGLHGRLDPSAPNAPEQYVIAGCNEPTVSGYRLYDRGFVNVTRTAGDGTVPLVSALDREDGALQYFISGKRTGITHGDMMSDPRVLALMTAILDGSTSSFALPEGFSTSLSSCFPEASSGATAMEFSAHGVKGMSVVAADGHSVGVDASGTIELAVPDSTYEEIGDNYFITVPAGEPYRVVSESTSSEDFTVAATEYDGAALGPVATYLISPPVFSASGSVPAAGTTTVTLDFGTAGAQGGFPDAIMRISPDIHSGSDSDLAGTSTAVTPIVVASSSDVLPPELSVSGLPDAAIAGDTATILFSATDTDSGIAVLRAFVNGTEIANGAQIVFSDTGTTTVRIAAMDRAGNPAVREIDIPVAPPAPPEELLFFPVADAYLDASHPAVHHGSDPILRIRSRGSDRALVAFDAATIRDIVGPRRILSASLVFTVHKNWQNWTASSTLAIEEIPTPWTESGVTWQGFTGSASSSFSATDDRPTVMVGNGTKGEVSFDIMSRIAAFLAGTSQNGWMVRKVDECAPGVIDFDARESDHPPILKIVLQ